MPSSKNTVSAVKASPFDPIYFTGMNSLVESMVHRNEEGIFSCGVCGKTLSYNHRNNMRKHVQTHFKGAEDPLLS